MMSLPTETCACYSSHKSILHRKPMHERDHYPKIYLTALGHQHRDQKDYNRNHRYNHGMSFRTLDWPGTRQNSRSYLMGDSNRKFI